MATENTIETFIREPTYTSLKDVIQSYLNRDDYDTEIMIPFFINAAEKIVLRNLRIPAIEKLLKTSIDVAGDYDNSTGLYYIMAKRDYLEMKHMWSNKGPMQRIPFEQMSTWDLNFNPEYDGQTFIDHPEWVTPEAVWSFVGGRIYLKGVAVDDALFLNYYIDVPELGTVNDTNVLLELLPDAFVFLAVAEGWRFLQEEEKANMWESRGMDRIFKVQKQSDDAEYSGSLHQIRP